MRTALVTGASGFTGSHLIARLRERGGYRITGTARVARTGVDGNALQVLDLTDATAVDRLLASVQPDVIFHLAGRNTGTAEELQRTNADAVTVLLEAVRRRAPEARVLLAGSAAEYGRPEAGAGAIRETQPCQPVSAYGASKLAATERALEAAAGGVRVTVVRPFNVVGRGMPSTVVLGAVLERARAALATGRDEVRVGRLDTERDFVAVEDVVEAYVRLADAAAIGMVVNVCSGEPRSVGSVVRTLLSSAPRPLRLVEDPALVRPADVPVAFGSNELAQRLIDFDTWTPLPVSLALAWSDD